MSECKHLVIDRFLTVNYDLLGNSPTALSWRSRVTFWFEQNQVEWLVMTYQATPQVVSGYLRLLWASTGSSGHWIQAWIVWIVVLLHLSIWQSDLLCDLLRFSSSVKKVETSTLLQLIYPRTERLKVPSYCVILSYLWAYLALGPLIMPTLNLSWCSSPWSKYWSAYWLYCLLRSFQFKRSFICGSSLDQVTWNLEHVLHEFWTMASQYWFSGICQLLSSHLSSKQKVRPAEILAIDSFESMSGVTGRNSMGNAHHLVRAPRWKLISLQWHGTPDN